MIKNKYVEKNKRMIKQKNISKTVPNADPCMRCGYCCKKTICNYGKDDGDGNCCFLKVADEHLLVFSCEIKDQIIEKEKDSNIPMFDSYCSSSLFNDVRDEVIRKIKND